MSEERAEPKGMSCPNCHRWLKSIANTCACGWTRGDKPGPKVRTSGYRSIDCSIEGCPENGTFHGPDGRRYCVTHELLRIDRDRLQRHGTEVPTFAKVPRPPL